MRNPPSCPFLGHAFPWTPWAVLVLDCLAWEASPPAFSGWLDSTCRASNIKKLCFHSSNCFSFDSHIWKVSYCWKLGSDTGQKGISPLPPPRCSLENEGFLQDGNPGLVSVLPPKCCEFWQSRASRQPWSWARAGREFRAARGTEGLPSVGIAIPKSELSTGPWPSCSPWDTEQPEWPILAAILFPGPEAVGTDCICSLISN